eukprot:scaffold389250_cov42-Prasinocladus_malaysianus.AAC.2
MSLNGYLFHRGLSRQWSPFCTRSISADTRVCMCYNSLVAAIRAPARSGHTCGRSGTRGGTT